MPEITLEKFEEVQIGGFRLDVGGPYEFQVAESPELNTDKPDKPYLLMTLKILGGIDQEEDTPSGSKSPVGCTIKERLYLNAKFMVKRYLISIGILARDDVESPIAKGKFNSDIFNNTKFSGMVTARMNDGKEYRSVNPIVD